MSTYYCFTCARTQGLVTPIDPSATIPTQYQLNKFAKHTCEGPGLADSGGKGRPQPGQGQPSPPEPPSGGSAEDGCPRPWEAPFKDEESQGSSQSGAAGDEEVPGLTESDLELLRNDVAKKVLDHCKNQGRCPAGMRRWAEEVAAPKLDYRRIIAQKLMHTVMQIKGNRDFSYRRPSRRGIGGSVIQPSLIDHQVLCSVLINGARNQWVFGSSD